VSLVAAPGTQRLLGAEGFVPLKRVLGVLQVFALSASGAAATVLAGISTDDPNVRTLNAATRTTPGDWCMRDDLHCGKGDDAQDFHARR